MSNTLNFRVLGIKLGLTLLFGGFLNGWGYPSNIWNRESVYPTQKVSGRIESMPSYKVFERARIPIESNATKVKLSEDAQLLLVGLSGYETVNVFNNIGYTIPWQFYSKKTLDIFVPPTTLDIRKDGNSSLLIAADGYFNYVLWRTDFRSYEALDYNAQMERDPRIMSVEISPTGDFFALGLNDGTLRIKRVPETCYDTTDMTEILTSFSEIYDVTFSPNGKIIGACGDNRVIEFYYASSGHRYREIKVPNFVYRLEFLNDSIVVAMDFGGFFRIYDIARKMPLRQEHIAQPKVVDFDISSDGKIAVVIDAYGHRVSFWEIKSEFSEFVLLDTLLMPDRPVYTMSLSERVGEDAYFVAIGGHPKADTSCVTIYEVRHKNIPNLFESDSTEFAAAPPIDIFQLEPRDIDLKALLIGIESFQDPNVRYLYYAEEDAISLFNVFLNQSEFFKSVDCELLLDSLATFGNVRSKISEILDNADENDAIYIFIATHGILIENPETTAYYLIMSDSYLGDINRNPRKIDPITHRLLSSDWLAKKLMESKAGFVMLIVDACNRAPDTGLSLASIFYEVPQGEEDWMLAVRDFETISNEKRLVILSSSKNEVAPEDPKLGHGVFTYYLLRGAKGEADTDADGRVSIAEIWNYVRYNVKKYAEAQGYMQHPKLFGTIDLYNRFPFVMLWQ